MRLIVLLATLLLLGTGCAGQDDGPSRRSTTRSTTGSTASETEPLPSEPVKAGNQWVPVLRADGTDGRYRLHLPPAYPDDPKLPLVVVFHGAPGTPQEMVGRTGFDALADEQGFAVVYPDAFDDPADVAALLDDVEARVSVDPQRIYAAGFSRGAGTVYLLTSELADRIAAFAPTGGVPYAVDPAGPASLLAIQGLADEDIPAFDAGNQWWSEVADCRLPRVSRVEVGDRPAQSPRERLPWRGRSRRDRGGGNGSSVAESRNPTRLGILRRPPARTLTAATVGGFRSASGCGQGLPKIPRCAPLRLRRCPPAPGRARAVGGSRRGYGRRLIDHLSCTGPDRVSPCPQAGSGLFGRVGRSMLNRPHGSRDRTALRPHRTRGRGRGASAGRGRGPRSCSPRSATTGGHGRARDRDRPRRSPNGPTEHVVADEADAVDVDRTGSGHRAPARRPRCAADLRLRGHGALRAAGPVVGLGSQLRRPDRRARLPAPEDLDPGPGRAGAGVESTADRRLHPLLPADAAAFVDTQLAPYVHLTWAQIDRLVETALVRFDPEAAEEKRQAAQEHRHLDTRPRPDRATTASRTSPPPSTPRTRSTSRTRSPAAPSSAASSATRIPWTCAGQGAG